MTSTFGKSMTLMLRNSGSCSLQYQPMVRQNSCSEKQLLNTPSFQLNSHSVWAIFWILFETGVLIGFVLLGVAVFKRTPDQMRYEAGTSRDTFLPHARWLISPYPTAHFLPT